MALNFPPFSQVHPELWLVPSSEEMLKAAVLDNCQPTSNLLFWGKLIEQMMVSQLQGVLEDIDYLDLFQSGFRPDWDGNSLHHPGGRSALRT